MLRRLKRWYTSRVDTKNAIRCTFTEIQATESELILWVVEIELEYRMSCFFVVRLDKEAWRTRGHSSAFVVLFDLQICFAYHHPALHQVHLRGGAVLWWRVDRKPHSNWTRHLPKEGDLGQQLANASDLEDQAYCGDQQQY